MAAGIAPERLLTPAAAAAFGVTEPVCPSAAVGLVQEGLVAFRSLRAASALPGPPGVAAVGSRREKRVGWEEGRGCSRPISV